MASAISGAVYRFPINSSRLDSLSLKFAGAAKAEVTVKYLGEDFTFPVGLDGRYVLGPYCPLHLLGGAMGKWTSEGREFQLDLNFIVNINHYTLGLRFSGDQVEVSANEASGLDSQREAHGRAPTLTAAARSAAIAQRSKVASVRRAEPRSHGASDQP